MYAWFIPTRVGQISGAIVNWTGGSPVHPHACGADFQSLLRNCWTQRFIPTRVGQMMTLPRLAACTLRFIPTRVGQMEGPKGDTGAPFTVHPHACGADGGRPLSDGKQGAVHPHACGADLHHPAGFRRLTAGSSPRVWGRCFGNGFTPRRHAGSSPRVWGRLIRFSGHYFISPVHPHACGADFDEFIPEWNERPGSSPRVWGRFDSGASDSPRWTRFIPTRVGQMPVCAPWLISAPTVHPHACGADAMWPYIGVRTMAVHPHACGADVVAHLQILLGCFGSSPRVWGRSRTAGVAGDVKSRFIPTRVGQISRRRYTRRFRRPVHPHACGADVNMRMVQMKQRSGSSPRVWGRFSNASQFLSTIFRFIPTRVGQMPQASTLALS